MGKKKRFCETCGIPIWHKGSPDYSRGKYCPDHAYLVRLGQVAKAVRTYRRRYKDKLVTRLGTRSTSDYEREVRRMTDELGINIHKMPTMRSSVQVTRGNRIRYYYDIGFRAKDDPQDTLSKMIEEGQGGERHPRYVEDFIEYYGEDNVKVRVKSYDAKNIDIDTKQINAYLKVMSRAKKYKQREKNYD